MYVYIIILCICIFIYIHIIHVHAITYKIIKSASHILYLYDQRSEANDGSEV